MIQSGTLSRGDVVVAGGGGDRVITAGSHADRVIGDGGRVFETVDGNVTLTNVGTDADSAGNDLIGLGNGMNRVLGGAGGDTITAGDDADAVMGDRGLIRYTAGTGALLLVGSEETGIGGADMLTLGDGLNVAIGGAGGDAHSSCVCRGTWPTIANAFS